MRGILAIAVVLLGPGSGSSQPLVPLVVGWQTTFRIDWSVGEERGQGVVQGYLENRSGAWGKRVRLLIDALENERVVGQRVSWLVTDLAPGTRVYFKVPVPAPASSYRVSVFDYDIRRGVHGPDRDAAPALVLEDRRHQPSW